MLSLLHQAQNVALNGQVIYSLRVNYFPITHPNKMEEKKKRRAIKSLTWKWGEWEMPRNYWSITIVITHWAGMVMTRPPGRFSFSFLPVPLSVSPGFTLWKVLPYLASSWPYLKCGAPSFWLAISVSLQPTACLSSCPALCFRTELWTRKD